MLLVQRSMLNLNQTMTFALQTKWKILFQRQSQSRKRCRLLLKQLCLCALLTGLTEAAQSAQSADLAHPSPTNVSLKQRIAQTGSPTDPTSFPLPEPNSAPTEQVLSSDSHTNISPGVKEIVEELEIEPMLNRLLSMRDKHSSDLTDSEKLERLTLKQEITNEILQTILEIHGTDARISYEIAQAAEIRAYFEERRDRAIKLNSIANIISGTVAMGIGNSLDLVPTTGASNTGDIIEMTGGAFQSGLAGYALKQQDGEQRTVNSTPNMLAKVLGREPDEKTDFAPAIWKYLNTIPPNASTGDTRKQRLIARWKQLGLLAGKNKLELNNRIDHLASTLSSTKHKISIDLLDDRARMLTDLSALVLQMERGLLELLKVVRSH